MVESPSMIEQGRILGIYPHTSNQIHNITCRRKHEVMWRKGFLRQVSGDSGRRLHVQRSHLTGSAASTSGTRRHCRRDTHYHQRHWLWV